MRAACQIICYLVTLLGLVFLGGLFDIAFWQTGFQAKHLLGGRPLPEITIFLINHHHLPPYLVLFPWLAFVGAPLLISPVKPGFWESSSFLLRFTTFLTVETFVFLLFLFAIALPFIPYYAVLEPDHESAIEFACRLTFWGVVCLLAASVIFGWIRRRSS